VWLGVDGPLWVPGARQAEICQGERGLPVPQAGYPCETTLISDVSIVSIGTLVSDVSIVSVVSVLKKSTRKKPLRGPGASNGQAAHHHHVFTGPPNRSPSSRQAKTSISASVEHPNDFTNLPSQPLWHWENASRSPGGPPTSAEQKYGPCG